MFLNNVLCVYINTLKSEPCTVTVKTYKLFSTDEKSVVNKHCNDIATRLVSSRGHKA